MADTRERGAAAMHLDLRAHVGTRWSRVAHNKVLSDSDMNESENVKLNESVCIFAFLIQTCSRLYP